MAAITEAQRTEIIALFDEGHSRNEIARRTGISAGSITNICRNNNRRFDRSATKRASEARVIDLAAARLELATEMHLAARDLLRRRNEPYIVYAFGGRDNVYREHEFALPPVEVVRNIVTTAGIAFDKVTKALEATPEGTGEAETVLDRIEAGIDAEFADVDDAEFGVKQ